MEFRLNSGKGDSFGRNGFYMAVRPRRGNPAQRSNLKQAPPTPPPSPGQFPYSHASMYFPLALFFRLFPRGKNK